LLVRRKPAKSHRVRCASGFATSKKEIKRLSISRFESGFQPIPRHASAHHEPLTSKIEQRAAELLGEAQDAGGEMA
jgi:hypothetical protein